MVDLLLLLSYIIWVLGGICVLLVTAGMIVALGSLRRCRATSRRVLFTPMNVKCGPKTGTELYPHRLIEGITQDGEKFVIEDCWKERESAHRLPPFAWKGPTTLFRVLAGERDDTRLSTHDLSSPHHTSTPSPNPLQGVAVTGEAHGVPQKSQGRVRGSRGSLVTVNDQMEVVKHAADTV